jgi:hypothetical protein
MIPEGTNTGDELSHSRFNNMIRGSAPYKPCLPSSPYEAMFPLDHLILLQITYKDNLSLNYINFNKFSVLGFQHPNNLQLSLQSPDTPRATCCPRNCKSG